MSLRTNRILRKFAHIKAALQRQATILRLPSYIRYHPINVKPKAGEQWRPYGETWEEDKDAEAAAQALGINLKLYGFDPSCEGTEPGEPSPTPEVEFVDTWDDFPDHLPPPIDTR